MSKKTEVITWFGVSSVSFFILKTIIAVYSDLLRPEISNSVIKSRTETKDNCALCPLKSLSSAVLSLQRSIQTHGESAHFLGKQNNTLKTEMIKSLSPVCSRLTRLQISPAVVLFIHMLPVSSLHVTSVTAWQRLVGWSSSLSGTRDELWLCKQTIICSKTVLFCLYQNTLQWDSSLCDCSLQRVFE